MRKAIFLAFLVAISISAVEAKKTVLLPDGYNMTDFEKGTGAKTLPFDTLIPILDGYLACWQAPYRIALEATQLTPASPCSVIAILYGVMSLTPSASKQCSLFVWEDNAGSPGNVLFRSEVTVTTDTTKVAIFPCNITPPVYVTGPFWVGNCEWDTLFPTSIVDSSCQNSKYDSAGVWVNDYSDYMHFAVVDYAISVEEKVTSPSVVTLKASPSLFSNNTSISYSVKGNDKNVQIGIYDITGNLVKELVNGKYNTGTYTTCWNGCDKTNKPLNSGVYFCNLVSGNQKITNKVILMK
ncbi:MAG: FlgD immunoglobulin-like domain containing protein [bacterium]